VAGDYYYDLPVRPFFYYWNNLMQNGTAFLTVWMLAVLTALAPALTTKFSSLESRGAKGPDRDYFYCVLMDESQRKRTFFSAVFSGDNSEQPSLETQFSSYVSVRYGGVSGSATCRFDKSRSVASMRREDDKTAANRADRAVIETNWRP
jgi:hypothetical protein